MLESGRIIIIQKVEAYNQKSLESTSRNAVKHTDGRLLEEKDRHDVT
jgi:hypothetical protein